MIPGFENFYIHEHSVSYYETDAMGVVHHSNYLRFFENARVAWMRDSKMGQFHYPQVNHHWAVLETRVKHLAPAFFGDVLETYLQIRRQKLKIQFQYVTFSRQSQKRLATGETLLVPVDERQKPVRLPKDALQILEKQAWTETWL